MQAAARHGVRRIEDIESPVGVAHAYDMTHILARAVALAGRAERDAVRDGLERVPAHDGLVRRYAPPFTRDRHEALGASELMMCRYRDDGVLVRVQA
jgi:branched-chain amino acid transport system substrate-binding protein